MFDYPKLIQKLNCQKS